VERVLFSVQTKGVFLMAKPLKSHAIFASNMPALLKRNRSGWIKIVDGITGRVPKAKKQPTLLSSTETEEVITYFTEHFPEVTLTHHQLKPTDLP
jgi:hypothetical protein